MQQESLGLCKENFHGCLHSLLGSDEVVDLELLEHFVNFHPNFLIFLPLAAKETHLVVAFPTFYSFNRRTHTFNTALVFIVSCEKAVND